EPAMKKEDAAPAADDDLFGPATPAAPAASDDDLFGPATEPAAPAASDDDLFGAPAANEDASEDDLFNENKFSLSVPGGLKSEEMRLWTDNTGKFTTRGRLIEVLDGAVRLLKENGRTTTVPMHRLSHADSTFVALQVRASQTQLA